MAAVLLLLPVLGMAQSAAPAAVAVADTASHAMHRTASGLRYLIHELGTGAKPVAGNRVAVRYTGFLPDGKAFDGLKPSDSPLRFRVGRGEVIPGWDELLLLLPAGSKARVWVPAALAYGATGLMHPNENRYLIPPNTELVFEIHLVSIR